MSPLFRKHPPPGVESLPHEPEILQAGTPYEFINTHEATLEASAQAWQHIAQRTKDIQNPSMAKLLEPGIAEICSSFGVGMSQVSLDKEAQRLNTAFAVYGLIAARYMSQHDVPDSYTARRAIQRKLFTVENPVFGELIEHKDFPMDDLMTGPAMKASADMEAADAHSSTVLHALVERYSGSPEGIVELAELYQSGAADADPHFSELREIVAADWHHYDKSQSILQQCCNAMSQDPQRYLTEFGQYVAEAMTNKRVLAVKQMAQFAIVAAQKQGLSLSVEEALSSTYEEWDNFEEVESLFRTFITDKKAQLTEAFATIAGPKNAKSIRLPRRIEEVEEFKSSLQVHIGSRRLRRGVAKNRSERRGSTGCLPDAEEIHRAATAEIDRQPLKIMVAKNISNGVPHVREISLDETLQTFSIGDGNSSLREDILKMVAHLQTQPLSRATATIRSRDITLQANTGRKVKVPLRRFAPDDCPGLDINGANRYYRVVFALHEGALVLVKILSHAAFDKEF
jgi:hypothetical protein